MTNGIKESFPIYTKIQQLQIFSIKITTKHLKWVTKN